MTDVDYSSSEKTKSVALRELESMGINPFPHEYRISHSLGEIPPIYDNVESPDDDTVYRTAGRVIAIRPHGKLTFVDLRSDNEKLQISLRQDKIGQEKYEMFNNFVHRGDFLGVEGDMWRSRKGELTLNVQEFDIIAKSLLDIPKEWYGLDIETRLRQRYLDMIVNPKSLDTFMKKSHMITHIRKYLENLGFFEVQTPAIQPIYGGASATPFTTYIEDLKQEWYLRISPELYLKRLTVGGFEKVYEICKNFRNESITSKHSPEFTMLELYWAYKDYNDIMELTEGLISDVAENVFGLTQIGEDMDLTPPWERMTVYDGLRRFVDIEPDTLTNEELKNLLDKNDLDVSGGFNRGLALMELFDHFVEPKLKGPIFIIDHPKETTPLCKLHREDPDLIERFEMYMKGMEIANAYTELNDPRTQQLFFEEQEQRKSMGDLEAQVMDNDYVTALQYGLPPTGGLGIGIDRLAMVLTQSTSIKDVIFFPMVKRE